MRHQEGYIPFHGFRTWYRIVGEEADPNKLPVLLLHGGPGIPSEYLEPLEALSDTGRRVIRYDQLGCGRSATPPNPSLWTIGLYLEEVDTVRDALGLDHMHLLGHSWGGMLALEYALRQPAGVASLIISDSLASIAQYGDERDTLESALPSRLREALRRRRDGGSADDPEYREAQAEIRRRHMITLDPEPECFARAMRWASDYPEVNREMNTQLETWDIRQRLPEIALPTLILVGRHGHVTPALSQTIHQAISGSELVVFEKSSHMPYFEEPEPYFEASDRFLVRVERQ